MFAPVNLKHYPILIDYSFDLFESQISHAYVRARTRGRESHLVHMVERSNDVHRRILSQITQLDSDMLRWTETVCNRPQSSIPPRTLRETINSYHSDSEEDEDDERGEFIKDPTTSGRIYAQDATTVLYRFAAALGSTDEEAAERPLFEYEEEQTTRAYICTILLPGSPVHKMSGPTRLSMSHSRRAACYQACVELSNQGFLSYRLFPLPSNVAARHEQELNGSGPAVNDLANMECLPPQTMSTENKSLGTRCYPRKTPDFWSNTESIPSTYLYPTVISTNHSDDASQPHAPILILTRQPLPVLSNFKLFFSGVPALVRFTRGAAFQVDEARLHDIYMYTIRICRAIANKPFVCSLGNMPYFFAPVAPAWEEPGGDLALVDQRWELPNVVDLIPWDLVALAARDWVVGLKLGNLEELVKDVEDAVIQDRWVEFTRRYDAVKMRPDLSPLSKPADSPVCYRVWFNGSIYSLPTARGELRKLGRVLQGPSEGV